MAHKPNDISRQAVKNMCSCGLRHNDIAKYMGISATTLRKHYVDELQVAKVDRMVKLVEHAYMRAFENDTVLIFLLKTYCGFRETDTADNEEVEAESMTINFEVNEAVGDVRVTKGKPSND